MEYHSGPASLLSNNHLYLNGQSRNGNWWRRRTPMERQLSLCVAVLIGVAVGLAISMLAVIVLWGHAETNITRTAFTRSAGSNTSQLADDSAVCHTSACVIAAAEILKNMDQSVDPCEDFYSFACGGFEKNTIIPDDESSVDSFSLLSDELTKQVRMLIETPIKDNDAHSFQLAKKLYQSCLNKTRVESRGLEPMKEILTGFGGWPSVVGDDWNESRFNWYETIYRFRQVGYSIDYLIDLSIVADLKNSTYRLVDLDQAILGMPGREYLIKGLADKDVKAYLEYQVGLAVLLGADNDRARKEQTEAVEFEIELAKINLPREERRDANKLYNPMTIKELSAKVPDIPWLDYMNTILAPHHVLTEDERVIVDVPDYFPKLTALLANTPKRTIANYLMWRVSAASVSYLNEAARNLQLNYWSVLYGTTERRPRWEECTDFVSGSLSIAVGAMYVREYFQDSARQSVNEIVKDLRDVFVEIIDQLEWMDPDTRQRAKDKAARITTHIGYPDELLDDKKVNEYYENLTLDATDYLGNGLVLDIFETNNSIKKLREPVNKTDWITHGQPAVVNAFYSFLENSIQFPAGVLQGVFFNKDRPMYLNYAAIGWIIGHEITHGFDDQGRQYDPDGNLVEWWDPKTKAQYLKRAQCVIDQYGNYSFPELELSINGINTQGENIADNGGIKEAYGAYIKWAGRQFSRRDTKTTTLWDQVEPRLPGLNQYNVRQLFWIGAANIWCEKTRPEYQKLSVLTGQHSPSLFRVRGPFANMPQFTADFGCHDNSLMNAKTKCSVW